MSGCWLDLCRHVGRQHLGQLVVLQAALEELLLRQVPVLVLVHPANRKCQLITWINTQFTRMLSQLHDIYQTNPAFKKKNLSRHFMFQHCQPMRNHHTEQLQGGNGKINSEKVSEQSSSIRLVPPYIISPCLLERLKAASPYCTVGRRLKL